MFESVLCIFFLFVIRSLKIIYYQIDSKVAIGKNLIKKYIYRLLLETKIEAILFDFQYSPFEHVERATLEHPLTGG